MAGPRELLMCSEAWDTATGTCAGDLVSRPEAQALAEFSLSDLTAEHLSLMFGAGFTLVGSALVVGVVCGVLLRFIKG